MSNCYAVELQQTNIFASYSLYWRNWTCLDKLVVLQNRASSSEGTLSSLNTGLVNEAILQRYFQ